MKRIQLFEFEDFPWLPSTIRACVTRLIMVFHRLIGSPQVIAGMIRRMKEDLDFKQVVDLASGSGGPMPQVMDLLRQHKSTRDLPLLLTDLHPNPETVALFNAGEGNLQYHPGSVDAADLNAVPKGLKTMIAGFHHLPPPAARRLLHSAQASKTPLLIFEVAENKIPLFVWWLFLPLSLVIMVVMCLVLTLFVRPLTWQQLLFTYLIPVIPIVYAWDSQATLVRTYTFDDLRSMIGPLETETYRWQMGPGKKADGKSVGYYVMGMPK